MTTKLPVSIKSISDIQALLLNNFAVWEKFGKVKVSVDGDLSLFNYTHEAMFDGQWSYFEQVSRGLILNNKTGEIVARPFDKFFNWGQHNQTSAAPMVTIAEKLDGSMGTLYRSNGKYKIATRGSFNSDQSIVATALLHDRYGLEKVSSKIPDELTLIFEIVYPFNRIVIDYGHREELVLLAVRNRHTGDYLPFFPSTSLSVTHIADELNFGLPKTYKFDSIDAINETIKTLPSQEEGYVVEFADGQRFKFKGDPYKDKHALISGLSYKNTIAVVKSGGDQEIRSQIPDEFWPEYDRWINDINKKVLNSFGELFRIWDSRGKFSTRKDFALWAIGKHKDISAALFILYDDREELFIDGKNEKLNEWVWKHTFQEVEHKPISRCSGETE